MLALFNKLLDWFRALFWKEEMELTLVGLQYSGKTTFVNVIAVSPRPASPRTPRPSGPGLPPAPGRPRPGALSAGAPAPPSVPPRGRRSVTVRSEARPSLRPLPPGFGPVRPVCLSLPSVTAARISLSVGPR